METGKVTKFDNRSDKAYGFIRVNGSQDVYFRLVDGRNIERRGDDLRFCEGGPSRLPEKGDILCFNRTTYPDGPKAILWGYDPRENESEVTEEEIRAVVRDARPGDKLDLIFRDETLDGNIVERILGIVDMHEQTIRFSEAQLMVLLGVAQSWQWAGFRHYTITLLEHFDPEKFITVTRGCEMLENITIGE